ncbi:MAG: hypothetical protein QOE23_285 [Pseudonocardiales bacterium]|jgi:hypothetical protein|nr:hypothetical protein [Pseudonocardiales bacterium]
MSQILDFQKMDVELAIGDPVIAVSNASYWECCSTGSFSACC